MKERISWIDAAKGIGILLVLISHTFPINKYVNILFFTPYMAFFFVLSGFTYSHKLSAKGEIVKKAKRLLIPYFIYGLIGAILICDLNLEELLHELSGLFYSRYYYFRPFGDHYSHFSQISPMWFLPCMFLSYVWVVFYSRIKDYINRRFVLLAFLMISFLFTRTSYLLPWSIDTSFVGSLLIILGMKIKEKGYLQSNINIGKISIWAVLIYIPLVCFNGVANMSLAIYGRNNTLCLIPYIFLGVLYTIIVCNLLRITNFRLTIIELIGRQSITLLCIQLPLIAVTQKYLPKNFITNDYLFGLFKCAIVIIVYVIILKIKRLSNVTFLQYL